MSQPTKKEKECEHAIDPHSIRAANEAGLHTERTALIDVTCKKCGTSGSIRLHPEDIQW